MQVGINIFNYDLNTLSIEDLDYYVVTSTAHPNYEEDEWNEHLSRYLRHQDCNIIKNNYNPILVGFVVEKDGSLSDFRVIYGDTSRCIQVIFEFLENEEKWVPGKLRDKIVKQKIVIPIQFE
jgi:hypothetical protein